jgi:hypothetical protein
MVLKVWFFLRPRMGEVHPLSMSKVDRFFKGGKLDVNTDEEGVLNYIQVIVAMEGPRALHVHSINYELVHTLPDGTLDRERYSEVLRASVDLLAGRSSAQHDPPGVINAVSRLAEQRLARTRWNPTPQDEEKLREAINHKAGHAIL